MKNYARSFYAALLTFSFLLCVVLSAAAQTSNLQATNNKQEIQKARNFINEAHNYNRQGLYSKAVDDYKKALLLFPNSAEIYNNLGTTYALQKQYDKAITAFSQAVRLNPELTSAELNLSVIYYNLNRPAESLAAARRAIRIDPQNINTRRQLCQLNLFLFKNEEAVSCYKNLQKDVPLKVLEKFYYGTALMKTNRLNKSLPLLKESAELLSGDAIVQNIYGAALFKKKNYKEAVTVLQHALDLTPNSAEIRYNLAQAQLANKDKNAAIKHYLILQRSNPAFAKKLYKSIYGDKVIFAGDS